MRLVEAQLLVQLQEERQAAETEKSFERVLHHGFCVSVPPAHSLVNARQFSRAWNAASTHTLNRAARPGLAVLSANRSTSSNMSIITTLRNSITISLGVRHWRSNAARQSRHLTKSHERWGPTQEQPTCLLVVLPPLPFRRRPQHALRDSLYLRYDVVLRGHQQRPGVAGGR